MTMSMMPAQLFWLSGRLVRFLEYFDVLGPIGVVSHNSDLLDLWRRSCPVFSLLSIARIASVVWQLL